jgi:predicted RND superfamily exporter protein
LAWSTESAVGDARRDAAMAAHADLIIQSIDQNGLPKSDDPRRARLRSLVGGALLDLELMELAVNEPNGPAMVDFAVSGTPLLHRGLSTSTRENQAKSLLGALCLVALVLSIRFRSLATGVLALTPTLGALALIYGGMGALGIRLDIGTSMLASIVIGAGVDFAVHQLSAWYASESEGLDAAAARANARTGTAILTNALAVAAGFFVLTLGEARPLKNVGGLTAAGLLVAAACTLTLIPALAKRRRYDPRVDAVDPADPPELRARSVAIESATSTSLREE